MTYNKIKLRKKKKDKKIEKFKKFGQYSNKHVRILDQRISQPNQNNNNPTKTKQ